MVTVVDERIGQFRGPLLVSTGPLAQAARNARVSMRSLTTRFGVSYSAVKMWDARRSAPGRVRYALRQAPYNVPASAWAPQK